MCGHDPVLHLGPLIIGNGQILHTYQEEAFIGPHKFAIDQREYCCPLSDLGPRIIDKEAGLFPQFPAGRFRVALALIERSPRRCPIRFPDEPASFGFEKKEQHLPQRVDNQ